ncbi:MAG: DUF3298 and DUF4163 domain-containing protein [Candidatus Azobacteroides sp.]|nr:DUF3298 and DUF4163 domain-containing protein [Candidatus Azobacteroides sp.]
MQRNSKILLWLIISCFPHLIINAQSYKDNSIKYGGIEEKKIYNLYRKKDNPVCRLKINFFYPEACVNKITQDTLQSIFVGTFFGKEYATISPKKAIKLYSNSFLEEYKAFFEKSGMYTREVARAEQTGKDVKDFSSLYNFDKTMRNTIMFNKGNIISQVINVYEYRGGAHGASSTQGMVVDINTGREIKYNEIFLNDTEEAMSALLLSSLMSSRNYTSQEALIEAGFMPNVTISPTDNLIADEKGITFIYNLYELGAYILGIVEIFVPYSDLVIYMKSDSPLYQWGKNYLWGNPIQFKTVSLNKEYFSEGMKDLTGFTANIQFTFPTAYHDKNILQNLQRQFITNAFGDAFPSFSPDTVPAVVYENEREKYNHFIETHKELWADRPTAGLEKEQSAENYFSKDYSIQNDFYRNYDNLVSYVITTSLHDVENQKTIVQKGFVVNLKTGRNLLYDDIFVPDSQKELTRLLKQNLQKENNLQENHPDYQMEKIIPHNNFFVQKEGIIFIYNPGEIAPQEAGCIHIELPYAEIEPYLKPDSPWREEP